MTEYKNGSENLKKKIMPSNKVFIDFVIPFLLVMYYIGITDNLKHFSSLLQKIILQVV